MAFAADDDMVVHQNPERPAGLDDLVRDFDIGAAGARVARGVVVDHPYGSHNVLIFKSYVAWTPQMVPGIGGGSR